MQEVLGVICAVPSDEPLQARKEGHERVWDDVENKTQIQRRQGARQKEECTHEGYAILGEKSVDEQMETGAAEGEEEADL